MRSFYFSEDFLKRTSEKLSGEDRGVSFSGNTIIEDRALWYLFTDLHELLLYPLSELELESRLLAAFAGLFKLGQSVDTSSLRTEDKRVALVTDYLRANLSNNTTLAELASLAGCTEYHLIRIFRAAKGLPPHSYLIQLRLENSRILLTEGVAVAEAALRSGFSDQSHLTRCFKSRYGLTPRRYQKNFLS